MLKAIPGLGVQSAITNFIVGCKTRAIKIHSKASYLNEHEMTQKLRVNKTNFHIKDFTLRFALKQRRKRQLDRCIFLVLSD